MSTEDECRNEFEAKCKLMRVEWSMEWDKAGFYAQLEADRAYTWFKLGFDKAKPSQADIATIAGLEASIGHLSSLVDQQLVLLEDVDDVCGKDGHGGDLEDGESEIIDRVRAHLAAMTKPHRPAQNTLCSN